MPRRHLLGEGSTGRGAILCLVCLCLVCLWSWPVVGDVPPERAPIPPIETFIQIGSAGSPQISADGTAVMFVSAMSGVDQVYQLLRSGWPYQLTAFVDGIDFYATSYTGRLIVVGASEGGSEQSNLYLVDTDTYLVKPLKHAAGVQHGSPVWSQDERYVYFRSNEEIAKDFYIYRIDVTSGAVDTVWEHSGWNEPVAMSADGTWLLVSHAESGMNNDLYLVDVVVGGDVLLTTHTGDCTFEGGRLAPDLKYVYFVTNMNDDGIGRVAREAIPGGPIEFINPDSPWETEEMDLSDDGETLAWIENVEGYSAIRILDVASGNITDISDMKGVASGLSVSNAERMVFSFQSASAPADVWDYDLDERDLDRLTRSSLAGVDASLFVEPELVHYKSFDGLGIPAFLYLPKAWDGRQIPFIIDIHGGPESQFRPTFNRHFQYLVASGYGVFAPNIRGSSGYGRDYVKLDDYKNRENAIRDIYEGAKWLVDRGYAGFGAIGIKGASYGGYATLAALAEYPEVFGAGLDDVGIANFVTFLANTAPYRRELREAEYGPLSDQIFLTEISPITRVDRIRAPLLIVHGANDPRVPVSEARQIAAAITARGGVVDTLIFADEGHGASKLANRLVYYRKMVDFFDKYLK
jgi:dipeptidyl aminopeptidase/acylaminoacyl peptidase